MGQTCEDTAYKAVSTELYQIGSITLRGTRIAMPLPLRQRVLQISHTGHPGIVRLKALLRTKVWWS